MAENRSHRVLLSIPAGARRSSVTVPDMVVTDTCPVPAPTLPLTVCDAGALTVRSDSNSVRTAPDVPPPAGRGAAARRPLAARPPALAAPPAAGLRTGGRGRRLFTGGWI